MALSAVFDALSHVSRAFYLCPLALYHSYNPCQMNSCNLVGISNIIQHCILSLPAFDIMSLRRHWLFPEPFYRIVGNLDEIDLQSLRLISREANQRGRRRPFKPHRRLGVRYDPSGGLNKLPPELLCMVVDYLEDRDGIALRRVSRRMASVTYERSRPILARCLCTLRTDLSSCSIASIPTINILKQALQHSLPNCNSFEIGLNWNERDSLSTDDVVHLLFHLFVEAKRRPEQLTLYSQSPPPSSTSPQALRAYHRITAHPDLSRAWSNLHTLTISEPYFEHLRGSLDFLFPRILEHAPRLERLVITGNAQNSDSVNVLAATNKAIPVCELKQIEIRNLDVRNQDLHDWLLENGRNLTSLTFSECLTETYQGWVDILGYVQAYCTELERWKMRLRELDPELLAPLE